MGVKIETSRLIIRPFEDRDADCVFALRSDPEIMRFIRKPQQNREESVAWIKLISSRWNSEGIGFSAVTLKKNGTLIGWCGLWRLKETGEMEVGYAIAQKFWKNGYASEAADAFLKYGFENLGLEEIVAVADPLNEASQKVMKRLGMNYDYAGEFYGRELVHYSLTSDEWKAVTSESAQKNDDDS